MSARRVLALDAFHGGSHAAVLDAWAGASRHEIAVEPLPARHWKWRMREGAVSLARRLADRDPGAFNALWCTDMLNLAEFAGLAPPAARDLPRVLFMHENQFAYPSSGPAPDAGDRDLHFAMTNVTSCLAATAVWWNSAFNLESFLEGARSLIARAPASGLGWVPGAIEARSRVVHLGVDDAAFSRPAGPRAPGPLRIAWAARWEHDKGPDTLFAALDLLAGAGVGFEVSVLGHAFERTPPVFAEARGRLGERVRAWGAEPDRGAYLDALAGADVFVSTARQEFFGLAVVEAAACATGVIVPRALAYPEVLRDCGDGAVFYDGGARGLADALAGAARRLAGAPGALARSGDAARRGVERFRWSRRVVEFDDALTDVVESASTRPGLG